SSVDGVSIFPRNFAAPIVQPAPAPRPLLDLWRVRWACLWRSKMNAKSAWPSGALAVLNSPRALPFAIAAISCALVALILGYTAWYFFGTHRMAALDESPTLTAAETLAAPAATVSEMRPPITLAPAGELPVAAGLVTLGGDTDDPIRKITV